VIDLYRGEIAHFLSNADLKRLAEPDLILQNQGSQGRRSSVFLRRELRHQTDWGPNPSFNRTCFGVAAPGVISFSPGFATLAHAG
jgi:hypothetical protein